MALLQPHTGFATAWKHFTMALLRLHTGSATAWKHFAMALLPLHTDNRSTAPSRRLSNATILQLLATTTRLLFSGLAAALQTNNHKNRKALADDSNAFAAGFTPTSAKPTAKRRTQFYAAKNSNSFLPPNPTVQRARRGG